MDAGNAGSIAVFTLDFKFLVERPVLWTVVIWTLLLGGAVVSFTGIVLSVKYIIRLIKSRIKRGNHQI